MTNASLKRRSKPIKHFFNSGDMCFELLGQSFLWIKSQGYFCIQESCNYREIRSISLLQNWAHTIDCWWNRTYDGNFSIHYLNHSAKQALIFPNSCYKLTKEIIIHGAFQIFLFNHLWQFFSDFASQDNASGRMHSIWKRSMLLGA